MSTPADIQSSDRIPRRKLSTFQENRIAPFSLTRETERWLLKSSPVAGNKVDNKTGYFEQCGTQDWKKKTCVLDSGTKHRNYNKMSEDIRKERNRRLAKEFREKKKLELELYRRWVAFLKQCVNELQVENYKLRQMVSEITDKDDVRRKSVVESKMECSEEFSRMNTMLHQSLSLFHEAALINKRDPATDQLGSFPISEISAEKGYPLSPVSQQLSPHKCHESTHEPLSKGCHAKDTNRVESLSTSDSSVLGIDALVHW